MAHFSNLDSSTTPSRTSRDPSLTLAIALTLVFAQLAGAAVAILGGWVVHFDKLGRHDTGPYFFVAFALLLLAWGTFWKRLWAIPLAAVTSCVMVACIFTTLKWSTNLHGPYALLGVLEFLIFFGGSLIGLIAQLSCAAFVCWQRDWRQVPKWTSIGFSITELLLAVAFTPVLYHLDYRMPAAVKAKADADREYFFKLKDQASRARQQ